MPKFDRLERHDQSVRRVFTKEMSTEQGRNRLRRIFSIAAVQIATMPDRTEVEDEMLTTAVDMATSLEILTEKEQE